MYYYYEKNKSVIAIATQQTDTYGLSLSPTGLK